jgi:hypothetical protein
MDKSKIFLPEPKNDKLTTTTTTAPAILMTKESSVTISGSDGTETSTVIQQQQQQDSPKIIVEEKKKKIVNDEDSKEKSLLEEISETLMSKQIVFSRKTEESSTSSSSVNDENNTIISSDSNNKIKIKNPESNVTNIYTDSPQKRSLQRNNAILKSASEKPKIQQVFPKNSDSDSDMEFCTISEYYDLVEAKNNIDVKDVVDSNELKTESLVQKKHSSFPNNHYKPVIEEFKRRSESYNLVEKSFMSSKITNDGLIVTKTYDDDSTESSFDDSSHEGDDKIMSTGDELDNNDKTSNTDYEIIELSEKSKNRYEPDGRSDPDGSSETSPQNVVDIQSKPKVPTKPMRVNNNKTAYQKQNSKIIMQLQQVMNKEKSLSTDSIDTSKLTMKKNRAPEPPENNKISKGDGPLLTFKDLAAMKNKFTSKTNTIQIKEQRTYPALNPKFRSLNNLSKSHETKEKIKSFENLVDETSQARTNLSLSQDSLVVDLAKKKKKFSIKKMLRMGSSNKAEISSKSQLYADIPTSPGESEYYDTTQTKPRLIIIHPLDINNHGVEVVKSTKNISMTNDVTSTLDLPPIQPNNNNIIISSVEKKLNPPMKEKGKAPSPMRENGKIYANLGEVRSSIAPKKPERTNSMREREAAKAQYLQRHQPVGSSSDVKNSSSIVSDEKCKSEEVIIARPTSVYDQHNNIIVDTKIVNSDSVSFSDVKKKLVEIENVSTRSKIEMFENTSKKDSIVITARMPLIKPPPIPSFNSELEMKIAPLKINIDSYPTKSSIQQQTTPMSPISPSSADELSSSVEMRRGTFSPIMPSMTVRNSSSKTLSGSHDDNALYSPVHQDIGKLSHFISS